MPGGSTTILLMSDEKAGRYRPLAESCDLRERRREASFGHALDMIMLMVLPASARDCLVLRYGLNLGKRNSVNHVSVRVARLSSSACLHKCWSYGR